MSFCANCGAQLMVGNQLCTRCGAAVAGDAGQAQPSPDPANVYAPPKANLETPADTSGLNYEQLEQMRSGQRLVILAILISFATIPLNGIGGDQAYIVSGLISLANLFLIAIGLWRLCRGHGYGALVSFLACLLGIVPLVGLILMIGLSISATGKLRRAGYKVGLLGAKAQAAS